MFQISELIPLRDRLVDALVLWGRTSDGFYRSSPHSKSTPSFTNTGIVLQAFVESRKNHLAHHLAESLLRSINSVYPGVFPHEKAKSPKDAHVMCNAWAAFAILDTFPNRVGELAAICKWFLDNQREDYSWSLIPGEDTREPIVTGYAISALQQFYRCATQVSQLGLMDASVNPREIARAIDLAVNYLVDARPASIKQKGLYLWPASESPEFAPPLSLGTSALCMHVLAKWGRHRGRSDLVDGVAATFKRLVVASDEWGDSHLEMEGHRLSIWDQFHLNEGSINYLWYFFAPITVVTLLRFAEHREFGNSPAFIQFAWRFIDWIKSNVREVDASSVGVSGGETLPEPKVWSTGLSVIVLSRVLERRDLFRLDEYVRRQSIELKMVEVVTKYYQSPPRWQLVVGSLLVGGLAALGVGIIVLPFLDQGHWQKYEGYYSGAQVILGLLVAVAGLKIKILERGLRSFVSWVLRSLRVPRAMRELRLLQATEDIPHR